MVLDQPDLDPLLQDISEETRNKIVKVMKNSQQVNLDRNRFWQSIMENLLRSYFQVLFEV